MRNADLESLTSEFNGKESLEIEICLLIDGPCHAQLESTSNLMLQRHGFHGRVL